jgi:uncharacterized protein YbjT (DUF2867 family)
MRLLRVHPVEGALLLLLVASIAESFAFPWSKNKAPVSLVIDEEPVAIPTKDVVSKVAVTGATGRTGAFVVSELLDRGVPNVVAVVRNATKAKEVFPNPPNNLAIVVCDLSDEKEIEKTVKDCDAGIWCATGFAQSQGDNLPESSGNPGKSIDLIGLPAFARSLSTMPRSKSNERLPKVVMCSSAGVTRLLWNDKKKSQFVGAADIPIVRLNPFNILDRKRESEAKLRKSGIPYVICRPCGLNDKWPADSRMLLSQGDMAVGRLNRKDLANVLVDVLSVPEATDKTFEIVGIAGYPKPCSLRPALSRLAKDGVRKSQSDAALAATYSIMQQLLPGEKQESAALAMGQTYEELDAGKTGRLGARGQENVQAVSPM